MNVYKKFTNYLLENHPLIWHSKSIQLVFAGLMVWILSYLIGYQTIDLKVLSENNIESLYFSYYFVLFHIITVIIILTIWAIYFFKNNAFKSYYPLEKGYFTKLFFYLLIPFTLIISAYFPYTFGAKNKTATFFEETDLKNDINKINLGYVFLVNTPTDYDFVNRAYPKPYPVQREDFNYETNQWNRTYKYIRGSKQKGGEIKEYSPSEYADYNVKIDGKLAQFYKSHDEYVDAKKCEINTLIYQLVKEENLDNPTSSSIINFSKVLINPSKYEANDFYYSGEDESVLDDRIYSLNYAPIVYDWVNGKKYSAIQNSIEQFKEVCEKYKIDHNINAKHMVRFLKYKNFKNFHKSITKSYEDNFSYFNMEDEMNQIESVLKRKNETIKYMASQHVYFFDEYSLSRLFSNLKSVKNNDFMNDSLIVILFISLSISWLFICFEFTSVKSFIISVPISGVIAIINSLIISFTNRGYGENLFSYSLTVFIITFSIVIGCTLIGLKTKKIKKSILTILLNLSYLASPIYFILIICIYNQSTKYVTYMDRCKGPIHRLENSFLMNPYLLFISSVIGILLFFPILKKWKSYEE